MDKKSFLIGCGVAAALCVALLVAFIGFLAYIAEDPKNITAVVDAPEQVQVGENFELKVEVANRRPKEAMALSDIDLGESYLAGFEIIGVEPTPKSSRHVPIDESRSYTFAVSIPPGTSRTFTFKLRAKTAGVYQGDVDVCEGLRFLTQQAQTRVQE